MLFISVLALLLSDCAGFRRGWESLPYVIKAPEQPPKYRIRFETLKRSVLKLPKINLGTAINNQVRTFDTHVYFYFLTLYINPKGVQTQKIEPGKTRITLRVSDHAAAGFTGYRTGSVKDTGGPGKIRHSTVTLFSDTLEIGVFVVKNRKGADTRPDPCYGSALLSIQHDTCPCEGREPANAHRHQVMTEEMSATDFLSDTEHTPEQQWQ